ncbi:MAG: aminotransferase class I/II-fold pyridoxal phosphate-dependent enzyme [Acidimicrobiales bacterium]|nr:aminotransferase class I/II-fold pyridoxal phosphate-dependent enzyme [Acidimicrobiales bacterium]
MATDFSAAIETRSAQGIAAAISRMVTAGEIAIGDKLPTVRALAKELDVSPTTVNEAWRALAAAGVIEPKGRNGTHVRAAPTPGATQRYRKVTEGPGHFQLDLSTGTPDPALLPDLGPILTKVPRSDLTSSYLDEPVLPALREQLLATWPFEPGALTVVDGAMDALDRVTREVVRLGDRVIVEHPTFPPIIDLLEQLGAEVIGVDVDDQGLNVDQFAAAMTLNPAMALIQPRAHNPTGNALSPRRARTLAKLVANTKCIVVEDDHCADVASSPLVSLGKWLPEQVVHVRSFSKSHGPDLRLAAIGGSCDVVDSVCAHRLIGPGWSSRILQSMLGALLTSPTSIKQVANARETYEYRRTLFSSSLEEHGVTVGGRDGINTWVPVADENSAVVALAAQGIGVAPGAPFQVRSDRSYLRVTSGLLTTDTQINEVALAVASSAVAPSWGARRR